MAKKATNPAPAPAPKHAPLELWSKGVHPALTLILLVVSVGLGLYKLASDREVDGLKGEVTRHAEQEQRAKNDAQWLRVRASRLVAKAAQDAAVLPEQDGPINPKERAHFGFVLGGLTYGLGRVKQDEAGQFGENVADQWEKAEKKAGEEVEKERPIDWTP